MFSFNDQLDWNVITRDLMYKVGGQELIVPGKKVTLRDDNNDVLGIVGNSYQVFQNSSLKDLVAPMVSEGLLTIENIGFLGKGEKVFIQAQLSDGYRIAGEEFRGMITLMNSHNGLTKLSAGVTTTRVVCSNTFAMAMGDMTTKLRHTFGIEEKALQITEVLDFVNTRMGRYAEHVKVLRDTKATLLDCDNVVSAAYGKDNVRARSTIQRFFRHGAGNSGENLFDVVNAITEYTTHQAIKDPAKRFASVNFGKNSDINRKAMNAALALV